MKIRFTLDLDIDARLITKIEARAGKNSSSQAAKVMMQEWSYFEDMTRDGRQMVISASLPRQDEENNEINLSGLDSLNLEL